MANVYSGIPGVAPQGVSVNDNRRMFNFGERIAELAPQQSPFFVYLSKVSKKPTDDPVFKFLERRHQWQRRYFDVKGAVGSASYTNGTQVANMMKVDVGYDKYGKEISTPDAPEFLLVGQVVMIPDTSGNLRHFAITDTPDTSADSGAAAQIDLTPLFSATCAFADNAVGQVVGSAWAEGSADPEGWRDEMYDREGYCQIFKTAIPMFSGTSLATKYRGVADEYKRVWQEKLMEHKMDIEHALLYGSGASDDAAGLASAPKRYSWGILPYLQQSGIGANTHTFTYANSKYDDILDALKSEFAPERGSSGNKLVLASRDVIAWFNKLGDDSFLGNTVTSSSYQLDVSKIPGAFGHEVTKVNTIFGNLHIVQEPLLRGATKDYALMIDMANVAYRPLSGNGVSRDTHIVTNVQNNDVDGRKDIIITEAGLEISLPETHAILKWS